MIRRGVTVIMALAMVLAMSWAAPGVSAAQDDPAAAVRSQYEAFQDAYRAGDLAAAELAARSALDAHAAADLDDVSRGVLLINLAIVLVESGQGIAAQGALQQWAGLPAEAVAPQAPLAALLQAAADYRADPAYAVPLLIALETAPTGDAMLSRQGLLQAQDLAAAFMTAEDFPAAARAWAQAARFSEAAGAQAPLMQGRALTGQGVAQLYADDNAAALATFTLAMETLAPFAAEGRGGPVTSGEAAYAEAMAWRGAARAKMTSAGQDISGFPDPRVQPAPLSDAAPLCALRVSADPPPETPQSRSGRLSVGAVVIAVSLDANGRVTEAGVAAFAPDPALASAVQRVLPRWRFEASPNAAPGCRMERIRELRVIVLRGEAGGRG